MDNQFARPQQPSYAPQPSSYSQPENMQPPPSPQDYPVKKRGKGRKFLKFLLFLILIGGACYGVYFWQSSEVKDLNKQLETAKTDLASAQTQLNQLKQAQAKAEADEQNAAALEEATKNAQATYDNFIKAQAKSKPVAAGKPLDINFINDNKALFTTDFVEEANKAKAGDNKYLLVCFDGADDLTGASAKGNSINSEGAKVVVTEEVSDKPSDNKVTVSLVLVEDKWLIDSVDITACK